MGLPWLFKIKSAGLQEDNMPLVRYIIGHKYKLEVSVMLDNLVCLIQKDRGT